jgi:hypothetical protein
VANISIRCQTTDKRAYVTEEQALDAMHRAAIRPRHESRFGHQIPIRVYRCEFCEWWHMTSKPKKKEA